MEYMPGGDFLGLLIRDNILSEAATKWYIAEMILCVEEAHSLRWIHRDIKPDNFLISASGHLKISDFGLAFDGHWSHDQAYFSNHRYSLLKHLGIDVEGDALDKKEGRSTPANMKAHANVAGLERHEKNGRGYLGEEVLNWRNRNGNRSLARSVVGTSQYMAPEIIRGEQYDGRCDWWGVAIILFECLYGHTPFVGEEGGRQQTKLNILVGYPAGTTQIKTNFTQQHKTSFAFPLRPIVSSRCQDLICNMIQEKENRLCSRKYDDRDRFVGNRRCRDSAGRYVYPNDAEEIKKHRWFKEIDWENLHLKTPPFVPSLKGWDDTQYFDEEEPISDFSATQEYQPDPPTEADLGEALRGFSSEVQMLARGYVSRPYDSVRLRRIEREIDNFAMTYEQRHYLRSFIKLYGRKERKRPRDRLLRDGDVGDKVLEIRKRSAFLGYSYRRIRRSGSPRGPCPGFPGMPAGSGRVKKMGHKPRLTIL
ncbi:MAG: hypothetical protein M1818_001616 [Claussenomyces sp. TS43310]|nr:MAG: hypothetical protein M1818_001616 [Claussenomyces sp. TS43310]